MPKTFLDRLHDKWQDIKGTDASKDFTCDTLISLGMATVFMLYVAWTPIAALVDWLHQATEALPFLILTNSVVDFSLHGGLILLWITICFGRSKNDSNMKDEGFDQGKFASPAHRILTTKLVGGHDFMAGGFAPRLFVAAIGLILFVNSNCIKSAEVMGAKFLKPRGNFKFFGWPDGMSCRASAKVSSDFRHHWLSRLQVSRPSGCYGTKTLVSSRTSTGILSVTNFYTKPGQDVPNLVHPYETVGVLSTENSTTQKVDMTKLCRYQCVKWKAMSVQGLLIKGGTIAAGGIFVERMANVFTTRLGPRFIESKTSTSQVMNSIKLTLREGCTCSLNRTFAFLLIMLVLGIVNAAVPKIDIDGFYTVDYYVTAAFTFSLVMACLFRIFHIRDWSRMVFTKRMWTTGYDDFISLDNGAAHRIDLYDWYHISKVRRAQYLLHYARLVDPAALPYYEDTLTEDEKKKYMGDANRTQTPEAAKSVPTSLKALREQLYSIQESLKSLQGGGGAKKAPTKSKKTTTVKCVKEFCVFSDVFHSAHEDPTKSGIYRRRRIVIKQGAEGQVLGKNHFQQLVVQWKNNGKIDVLHSLGGTCDKSSNDTEVVQNVIADIDSDHVVEFDKQWEDCQRFIDDWIAGRTTSSVDNGP